MCVADLKETIRELLRLISDIAVIARRIIFVLVTRRGCHLAPAVSTAGIAVKHSHPARDRVLCCDPLLQSPIWVESFRHFAPFTFDYWRIVASRTTLSTRARWV